MTVTGLIDWPAALLAAHAAVARPADTLKATERAVSAGPVFRNKDFPLSPVPVLVRAERAERLAPLLTRYVDLLGKVVALYRARQDVRDFYGLDPAADRLIEADRAVGDAPWVCRLDGYLEAGSERLRVLENNADSPAGTLFTARINDVVARIRSSSPAAMTYSGEHRFPDALRAAAR
ncbi:hypothetical protein AB0G02_41445, partial [Actinosynnema sp. NPDC023658]|uniref:hypothetical protein n=1 Tax=Actinosynnema sp. NPDC023658 TaxID=3155465 RepID=UPI0033E3ED75